MKKQISFFILLAIIANSFQLKAQSSSSCSNADFEYNNFTNWIGYTGSCCPVVMTNTGLNTVGYPGDSQPQQFITSPFSTDINTPNPGSLPVAGAQIPVVAPNGGLHSVRLGNSNANFHAERLTYSFVVSFHNDLFYYWYAAVLEDAGHNAADQPGFEFVVTDASGNHLGGSCGYYQVVAAPSIPGFYTSSYNSTYRCKNWTFVGVDLSPYIGQTVTIRFTTFDCGYGNHFGYAYLEAGCAPLAINLFYCAGTTSASATAPSGFTYSWTGPGISSPITTQTLNIPSVIPGTVYSCVCTSANGCSVTLTTTLIASQVTASYSYTKHCKKIILHDLSTISGPGTINQWNWDFGDGNTSTSQNPSHVYNSPGSYTITLTTTADNGCLSTYSVTINIIASDPNFLNVTATPTPSAICRNSSSMIICHPGPTGIIGVNYSWVGPAGYSSTMDTIVVSPSTTSSYYVTTQDSFCIAYDTAIVTVHPLPIPLASSNSPVSIPICVGASLNLNGLGAGNGGAYTWAGPNNFSSTLQNPSIQMVNTAAAGQYSLTVTDTYGCTAVTTTHVGISPSPVATAGNDGPHCAGVQLNLTAGGGSTYLWSGPNSFTSTMSNPSITFTTPLTSGIYHVTVTNAGGCTDTASTVATIYSQPSPPIISSNSPLCEYNTLNISVPIQNGATYSWTGPNGFTSSIANPSIVNPHANLATGQYYVTATIAGCTSTSNAAVVVQATPSSLFTLNQSICQYQTATLNYNGPGQSGVNYSYSITGTYTPFPLPSGPGPFTLQWNAPGVYTVTLTVTYNTAPACTSTTSHQINVVANSITGCCTTPSPNAGTNSSTCGLSYTLQGSIPYAGNTGTWTQVSGPGSSVFSNNTSNVSNVFVSMAGSYVFRWTETSGQCVAHGDVQITFVNQPVADAGFNNDTCGLVYTLHAYPGNGTSYYWSGNGNFTNASNAVTSVTSLAGYGVIPFIWTETNTLGSLVCQDKDTVYIHFYRVPLPNAGISFSVCGLHAKLNAQPVANGNSGAWSQVSGGGVSTFSDYTSDSSHVSVTLPGSYYFQWMESNGSCSATSTVTVTFVQVPVANAGQNGDTCGKTFILHAHPSIGTGLWTGNATFNPNNTSQTSALVSNYGIHTFYWTETNHFGSTYCSDMDSTIVDYHEIPVPEAGMNDNACGSSYQLNADTLFPGYWTGPTGATYDNTPSGIFHPHAVVSAPSFPPVLHRQYSFYWHETNTYSGGTCIAEDSVNIIFYLPPHAEAGVDTITCDTAGYLLHSDTLGAGATGGYWTSKIPGVRFNSNTVLSPRISIGNLIPAVYGDSSRVKIWFYWAAQNTPACTSLDSAFVMFYQTPVANAGPDDSICGKDYLVHAHNSMDVSSGSWSQLPGTYGGPGTANFNFPTEQITQALVNTYGTYHFVWRKVNPFNTTCQSRDTVQIIYLAVPNPDAGPDTAVCGIFVHLHAITGQGNHGLWSSVPTGTVWYDTIGGNSGSNYATDAITWARFSSPNDTVKYIWQEYNSICVARDSINVYFAAHQTPVELVNAVDSTNCGLEYIRLNAQNPTIGIGYWIDSVPNTHYFPVPMDDHPDSTVVSMYGMHHFQWVIHNGACFDSSQSIPVRFIQIPHANAGGHNWNGLHGSQIKTDTTCGYIYYLYAIPSFGTGTWNSQDPTHTWFNQHGQGVSGSTLPNDTVNTSILTYNTNPPYRQLIWSENNAGCTDADTLRLMFAPIPNGNYTTTMPTCIGDSSVIIAKIDQFNGSNYGLVHYYWSFVLPGGSLDTTIRFDSDTTNFINQDTIVVRWTRGNFHIARLVTLNKYGCNSGIMTDTIFEPAKFNPGYSVDTSTCHKANGRIILNPNHHIYQFTWDSTFSSSSRHDTIQSNLSNKFYTILVYGLSVSPDAQPGSFCVDTLKIFVPDTGEDKALFDTTFFADSMLTIAPFTTTFINQSTGAVNYLWKFYDNYGNNIGQSNDTNPTFTFQHGVYTIVLIAESKYLCKDTMIFRNLHIRTSIQNNLSDNFSLSIFPNPFKDLININYKLNELSEVNIEVIDILGNKIKTIVNSKQRAGEYSFKFNGKNQEGLQQGVYFIKFTINNVIIYKKIIMIN